jgi:hypothetical protein
MSWQNLNLYSAAIPTYNNKEDKKTRDDEVINGDDPKNRGALKKFIQQTKR